MSSAFQVDPLVLALAGAVGLLDADGRLVEGWFDDPLDRLGRVVSDPTQRRALFDLIELAVPASAVDAADGERWHRLVSFDRGGIYLTVAGDVVGVAARVGTSADPPRADLTLRLPLIDASDGVKAVAGTSDGPLELRLDLAAVGIDTAVRLIVDLDGGGAVRIVLRDVDTGDGSPRTVELDPTDMGGDAAAALVALVQRVLDELELELGDDRIVAHLPGVLGFRPGLPPLPLDRLVSDGTAFRAWLGQLADDLVVLRRWFRHLAGLLGAGPSAGEPGVDGDGTESRPLEAPLVDLGDDVRLLVALWRSGAGTTGRVSFGLRLEAAGDGARLEAGATIATIPTGGTLDAVVLPDVAARVVAVSPLPPSGELAIGAVSGGLRWNGVELEPELQLRDVVLGGKEYPVLDLSSADAVVATAAATISDALADALGSSGPGRNLAALIGLVAPASDPTSPHRLDVADLAGSPTAAVAAFHHAVLGDAGHPWSHLLAEVGALLGLGGAVVGAGTVDDPWRVRLAESGSVGVHLAAWDAPDPAGRPQGHGLRLGLCIDAEEVTWRTAARIGLVGFDLAAGAPTATALVPEVAAAVSAIPPAVTTALGARVNAAGVGAEVTWRPGAPARLVGRVAGLEIRADGEHVAPFDIVVPPTAGLDVSAPDLGLGIPAPALGTTVRVLAAEAAHAWGGPGMVVLTALVGLHRHLPGLPTDWPLLLPSGQEDLAAVLHSPAETIRRQIRRLTTEASSDGTPFALPALRWLDAVVSGHLPDPLDGTAGLAPLPAGWGTEQHPWRVRLPSDERVELLAWASEDGPLDGWRAAVAVHLAGATDGEDLVERVTAAAGPVAAAHGAAHGRDPVVLGAGLDALDRWFADGDGLVPLVSQCAVGPSWQVGEILSSGHADLPSDPGAIAQIRAQLDAWAAPADRCVLLVSAPFGDHRAWAPLLAAIDPGRAPDAQLDLRGPGADPLPGALSEVRAVSATYTVDLADRDADPLTLVTQLGHVVDRVRTLTGRQRVHLVAHSTAGVTARAFAAARPDRVAGLVTLGTPHAGSSLEALTDRAMAEAVRFAAALAADQTSPRLRALAQLAAVLDRSPTGAAPTGPVRFPLTAFDGLAPDHTDPPTPGLALGSALGSGLVHDLADAIADQVFAAGAPASTTPGDAHLGLGLAIRPPLPAAGDDDPQIDALVRVPLGHLRLDGGPAPAVDARRRRLQVDVFVSRLGGWLAGDVRPTARADEHRTRWAHLGLVATTAGIGGTTVSPIVDLHDAAVGGPTEAVVPLVSVVDRLADLPPSIALGDPPGPGTAGALLLDTLRVAGLVTAGPGGEDLLDLAAVGALAAGPIGFLRGSVTALADLVLPAVGATGPAGGPWRAELVTFGGHLQIERAPWKAVLHAGEHLDGGGGRGTGLSVAVEGTLQLPSGGTGGDLVLRTGASTVTWSGTHRTLTAGSASWSTPLTLWPVPGQPVAPPGAPLALGSVALSAVLSAVVDPWLPEGQALRPLGRLLTAPGAFLLAPEVMGRSAGPGLDAARLDQALGALGSLLGLEGADGGLALPGGITLRAAGSASVALVLGGTLDLGPGEQVALDVGVTLDGPGAGQPTGLVRITRAVPGGWGSVTVAMGADPSGLSLSVTPERMSTITLLPRVDGLAVLAGGAAKLLPRVLQTLVTELRADGSTHALLDATLALATALGIYGDDAQGFERPDRVAELTRMTQPGWLASRTGSATAVATLIVDVLDAVALPIGTIDDLGPCARWSTGLAGGLLQVTAGWSDAIPGGEPIIAVELLDLDLGPVVIEAARLGYDDGVQSAMRVVLHPPDEVAFLRPTLDVDVDGATGGFAVRLLPLGVAAQAEAAVTLAPRPAVVLTDDGALQLVERWGLPLVSTIVLRAFDSELNSPLWRQGPTTRSILETAGLVQPGSRPASLVAEPPPPVAMGLRALRALAGGLSVQIDQLRLSIVTTGGRSGVRLSGRQAIDAGQLTVSLRLGDTDWLDPSAGVTLWLLQDVAQGDLPALRPTVEVEGLGVVVTGKDRPLVEGALHIGSGGVFVFLDASFVGASGDPELSVRRLGVGAQLDEARLVVSPDDADSFIAQILPSNLEAALDVAASWREGEGFRLHRAAGSGGLEVSIPLDIRAAILHVTELWLRLRTGAGSTALAIAVSGNASLGPTHLVVQRVGLEARVGDGRTGIGFRPPDGAGLSIDAGVVSGGGYLAHDESRYQYAGALQLQFSAIALKAVGIITTRRPDGSPGFSLLVIISAEFAPIQLGFGFNLVGVGGLLGLHRTTDLPVLRSGVREGTLGSILFPDDVVANAPKIISDLTRVFPQSPGRFLVGPMAKLAWGSPPIVTLELGIVIDLPAPVRLIILGRVQTALPDGRDAVIALNLDVLGVVDFDRGEVSIDASLFDSRVAAFDITGDMALRASWGHNPMFAMAAGGFHPRFQPPPGFPSLRRLAISLATGDNPRIRLESYLALTSNTAQIGARLELYASAYGFTIQGWLAFDALLQFDPFAFAVDMSGGVQLRRGSKTLFVVMVELHLSGPRPWHARGRATFQVLFIKASIHFDVRFGRADRPPLSEPVDVAALVEAALLDVRSWTAQLPPADGSVVTLRELVPGAGELLAHPLGSLSFTQRVAPLDTTIERFGTARPKGDKRFEVAVTVDGQAATIEATLEEQFAPAQFFVLSDDARLTQPSFTRLPAGRRLGSSTGRGRDHWEVRAAPLDYEVKLVDRPDDALSPGGGGSAPRRRLVRDVPEPRPLDPTDLTALLRTSPSATAATRRIGSRRFAGPVVDLDVHEPVEPRP